MARSPNINLQSHPYDKLVTLFLALLLCFLIPLSSSVFVFPGSKLYGESCTQDTECRETGFCDLWSKKCLCPIMQLDTFLQVFDKKRRTCLSAVGRRCTLDKNDGLPPIGCVSNAVCRHKGYGPKMFGWCVCRKRYYESKYGLCATLKELEEEETNEFSVSEAQNVVIPTVMMTTMSEQRNTVGNSNSNSIGTTEWSYKKPIMDLRSSSGHHSLNRVLYYFAFVLPFCSYLLILFV